MLNFTGFCTYPLGGSVTAALLFSTMTALTLTIYATMSCRFVVLTFSTTTTNNIIMSSNNNNNDGSSTTIFEEYFQQRNNNYYNIDNDRNSTAVSEGGDVTDTATNIIYRTSLGLYQWLRPLPTPTSGSTTSTAITDWTVGTCVGYQQTMLSALQSDNSNNILFDLSRIMAIFAILLGVFQFSWMFLSSCMSMNQIQMYLFIFLSVCGTIFTGFTFLFYQSTICTTEFDESAYCVIDQGGLVMIAAIVLWFITLLISIYYVIPVVRVISSTDSIDFELHKTRTPEQKQKLALQREIYKELRRQQKEQRAMKQRNNTNHSSSSISSSRHRDELPLFITPRKPRGDGDNDNEDPVLLSRTLPLPQQTSFSLSNTKRSNIKKVPLSNPSDSIPIRNSYSYDSKESWLRPIPKRSSTTGSNNDNKNTTKMNIHDTNSQRPPRHFRSMSLESVPVTHHVPNVSPTSVSTLPQRPSSLSRLIPQRPLSIVLPRMKKNETTTSSSSSSSSLSRIIVEPQETGDIEMQHPDHDAIDSIITTTATATTNTNTTTAPIATTSSVVETTVPSPPPVSFVSPSPRPPSFLVPTTQVVTTTAISSSLSSPTTTTTTMTMTQPPTALRHNSTNKQRPLDVYIAQRLDNIEKLM